MHHRTKDDTNNRTLHLRVWVHASGWTEPHLGSGFSSLDEPEPEVRNSSANADADTTSPPVLVNTNEGGLEL